MPKNFIDGLYYFLELRPLPKPEKKKVEKLYFFTINFEKKCLFLKLYEHEKITIYCHEEDEFNWKIGLGIAISKLRNNAKHIAHRKFFRTNGKLDLEAYTTWVIREFYNNDMYDMSNVEKRVEKALAEEGNKKIITIDL